MAERRRSESAVEPTPGQEDARHPEPETEHLREIVAKGDSEWTPAILAAGVYLVLIPIVALVMGIAFAVYYLA